MWRQAVVAAAIVLLLALTYWTVRLTSPVTPPTAIRTRVPDYHVMPHPARTSAVRVNFATPPRPGGRTGARPARPVPPFAECAGAGRDCGQLIQVTNSGSVIEGDPAAGPYDGSAATLVGVVNSSGRSITSLAISADTGVFAFAEDGACSGRFSFFRPARGCPFGPTGYEGPGIAFSGINNSGTVGTVSFARPLAPGKTAWFSLAQALAARVVAGGGPSAAEQGGAPNDAEQQAACSQLPVNCATGALWLTFTDFSVPGRGVPLLLTRSYVSADAETDSPFGYGWTDDYAMRLAAGAAGAESVIQEDGAEVTFRRNAEGGYAAPSRVLASLARNGDGTFTFMRYGSRVRYHFTAGGRLASESDANGNITRLEYNPGGTLRAVRAASGRTLRFSYGGDGLVSRVTNPLGHGETFRYDEYGNLRSVANDVGDIWEFGYRQPATHLLTSIEEPSGRGAGNPAGCTTRVTYRGSRVAAVSEPGFGTTTWSYSGNPATAAGGSTAEHGPGISGRPDGAVTTYDYQAMELVAVTVGSGAADAVTTGYTYTTGTAGRAGPPAGLVSSETDPELHVTAYAYDHYGNLTSVTNPLGNTIRYAYQEASDRSAGRWGEVTRVTMPGPGGATDTYRYDPRNGNLLRATDGSGNWTAYAYGGPHRSDLREITGPGGSRETLAYDSDGDVASEAIVTGSGTDTTAFSYNADGELKCEVPPGSGARCPDPRSDAHAQGTQSYTYNSAGEQVTSTSPAGRVTHLRYDRDGNTSAVTTPDHVVTSYAYDPSGQQTQEAVRRLGSSRRTVLTTLAYYGDGLLAYQTAGPDGGSAADVTTDHYDNLGRLRRVTGPLGVAAAYAYGRDGELETVTGAAGQTSYAYDAAGEMIGVRYSAGATPAATYTYYPDGQPETMSDGTGTTTYTYGGAGRLTRATHHGAWASQYSYRYEDARDTVLLTYPDGKRVTYTYDQAGRLVKVADWLGHSISFSYAPGGALNAENFPGGIGVTDNTASGSGKSGDTLDVVRNGTTLASFTDYRNPEGLLTGVTTSGLPRGNGTVRYSYYDTGQLKSAGPASFAYDPAGGGVLTAAGGGTQQFNTAGELQPAGGAGYAYGHSGNLTEVALPGEPVDRMSYNQAAELTRFSAGPATARYSYDGNGLLASETVGGVRTGYTWDVAESAPVLLAAGPTSYVYGPDGQPVEQISGRTPTYLIADQQGSTRLLTSDSGAVTGSYRYSPYGRATYSCPDRRTARCETTALQFGGRYTDGESRYLYLGGRYYDPSTGQFLTGTSPGAASAQSPYVFAADDPVNMNFTGLSWAPVAPRHSWWDVLSWGWKQWALVIGAGVLIAAGALITGGADLPAAGALAGAVEGTEAVEAGAGVAETAEAAGEVAELPEDGVLEDAGTEDDPGPAEAQPEGSASEDPGSPGASASPGNSSSCWRLSSQTSCLDLLNRAWQLYQLKSEVTEFLIASKEAVDTCANQNTSVWQCANKAFTALQKGTKAYETARDL